MVTLTTQEKTTLTRVLTEVASFFPNYKSTDSCFAEGRMQVELEIYIDSLNLLDSEKMKRFMERRFYDGYYVVSWRVGQPNLKYHTFSLWVALAQNKD